MLGLEPRLVPWLGCDPRLGFGGLLAADVDAPPGVGLGLAENTGFTFGGGLAPCIGLLPVLLPGLGPLPRVLPVVVLGLGGFGTVLPADG